MQVDVSDIFRSGEGHQADFDISDEIPQLDGITLTAPLEGSLRVIGTVDGVLVTGDFAAEVELECSRCLRTFSYPVEFALEAEFSPTPDEDSFGIDKYGNIDLNEPVRQEIEVRLPLSPLCQDDCGGIELKQKKDS
jgi:DUF177 domain-containing protein